jgi:hypothetical protein
MLLRHARYLVAIADQAISRSFREKISANSSDISGAYETESFSKRKAGVSSRS